MASSEGDQKLNQLFKMSFYKSKPRWKIASTCQPQKEDVELCPRPLEKQPQSSHDTSLPVDNHKEGDHPTCLHSHAAHTSVESLPPVKLEALTQRSQCNNELNCSNQVKTQKETPTCRLKTLLKLAKEAEVVQSSLDQDNFEHFVWSDSVDQSQDDGIPTHLQQVGAEVDAGEASASGHIEANVKFVFDDEPCMIITDSLENNSLPSCSVHVDVDSSGDSDDWCCSKHSALPSNKSFSSQSLDMEMSAFETTKEANSSSYSNSFVTFMRHVHGVPQSSNASLQFEHGITISDVELVQLSNEQLEKGIIHLSNEINKLIREYYLRKKEQPSPEIWVEKKSEDGKPYYYHSTTRSTSWIRPQDSPNCKVITQQEMDNMEISVNPFHGDDPDQAKMDQAMPTNPIDPIQPMNPNVMGDVETLMGLCSMGQLGRKNNPSPVSNQPSTININPIDMSEVIGKLSAKVETVAIENPISMCKSEAVVGPQLCAQDVFLRPGSGSNSILSGLTHQTASEDPTPEVNPFHGDDPDQAKMGQAMSNPINPIGQPMNQNVMGDVETLMGNLCSMGQLGRKNNPSPVSNQPSTININPIDMSEVIRKLSAKVETVAIENPISMCKSEAAVGPQLCAPDVSLRPGSGSEPILSSLTHQTASEDPTPEDEASQRVPVSDDSLSLLRLKSTQKTDTEPQRARKVPYAKAVAESAQDITKISDILGLPLAKRICNRRYTK